MKTVCGRVLCVCMCAREKERESRRMCGCVVERRFQWTPLLMAWHGKFFDILPTTTFTIWLLRRVNRSTGSGRISMP